MGEYVVTENWERVYNYWVCVWNDSEGKQQGDKQSRGGSLLKKYTTTAAGCRTSDAWCEGSIDVWTPKVSHILSATARLHGSKYVGEERCLQVNIGVNIIRSVFFFPKGRLWWLSFVGNNVPPKDITALSYMPKLDGKIIQDRYSLYGYILYLIKPWKKGEKNKVDDYY